MIHSMTGYGAAERTEEGVSFAVEVRSVNHRYLKVHTKLSESLQRLDVELDKLIRQRLSRGAVTLTVRMRSPDAGGARPINQAALRSYLDQLTPAAADGVGTTIDLATLALLPGVCEPDEPDEATVAKRSAIVHGLLGQALDAVAVMRRDEGRALRDDLLKHFAALRARLKEISDRSPVVVEEYHERLKNRVSQLMQAGGFELEAEGLMREVAVFAERSDISEEVARLTSHVDQCVQLCEQGEQVGRTLDFLAQEMLREANTIGSKCNDTGIARNVVEMKALIDRIKEQVQNVE